MNFEKRVRGHLFPILTEITIPLSASDLHTFWRTVHEEKSMPMGSPPKTTLRIDHKF